MRAFRTGVKRIHGEARIVNRLFMAGLLITCGMCALAEQAEIAQGVVLHEDLFNAGMREGVACYRIPALATAADGTLLAAIDERRASCEDLGKNEDIDIVLRRSTDNGVTWSPIETVADYELGISASDPSLLVDGETGDVFLFYNYMDHNDAPGVYRMHVMKSSDHGRSWSEAEDITGQITKPAWHKDFKFITSGRGTQARDGTLLHTLVNLKRGLHVFGSRDHGASWFLVDHALTPGDESKIVELADGRWMVNSRVRGAHMRYVHISADEGQTWTTRPEPVLVDPACNASLIRYSHVDDGHDRNRLLFSNANAKDARKNLSVRISYDEGATWSEGKTIYAGGSAYSSLTILDNGEIGLLFEKDGYRENVFVRFTLEWLTDGEDRYTPAHETPSE